jgi:hypothetical protein
MHAHFEELTFSRYAFFVASSDVSCDKVSFNISSSEVSEVSSPVVLMIPTESFGNPFIRV